MKANIVLTKSSDQTRPKFAMVALWVASLAAVSAILMTRWLTSNKWGLLTLFGTAYLLLPRVTSFQPWSFDRVLEWTVNLPSEALLGSVGFFIAYWIAVNTWQSQKRLEIKLAVAADIDQFFQGAAREALSCSLLADRLMVIRQAIEQGDGSNAIPDTAYAMRMLPPALASRAALSTRAVDVHTLRATYELVLSSSAIADQAFKVASTSLARIAESMWYGLPEQVNSPLELADVVARLDRSQLENFVRVVDRERRQMLIAAGGIRGLFQGAIIKPGLYTILSYYSTSRKALYQSDED